MSEPHEAAFTQPEILAAPLLRLIIRRAEKGLGGPTYGTRYDLSEACPRCGTGARQVSPLVLDRAEIPKGGHIFRTLDRDILISPELGQSLRDAGVSGFMLGEVKSKTGKTLSSWVQLLSEVELPPMDPTIRGIVKGTGLDSPCPRCGRDGHFAIPKVRSQIVYRAGQVDLHSLPDVVHTYECFGLSRLREPFEQSHFATPLLLVKPKVIKVFQRHKVRRLEFDPVKIIDA